MYWHPVHQLGTTWQILQYVGGVLFPAQQLGAIRVSSCDHEMIWNLTALTKAVATPTSHSQYISIVSKITVLHVNVCVLTMRYNTCQFLLETFEIEGTIVGRRDITYFLKKKQHKRNSNNFLFVSILIRYIPQNSLVQNFYIINYVKNISCFFFSSVKHWRNDVPANISVKTNFFFFNRDNFLAVK